MARILVVKHLFPYPPNQGTRRVSLGLLRDLAPAHDVVYLCQREHPAEKRLIPEIEALGVRVVAPLMPNHLSPAHRLLYKLKNRTLARLRHVPEVSLYWSNATLRRHMRKIGREFHPELTLIENWETYPLRRCVTGGVAAMLAHDAAYQILERSVAATDDPAERTRRAARLAREKELEIDAWARYDGVLTLTEQDRVKVEQELQGRGYDRCVRCLPVPVADEFFAFPRPAQPAARIGFLGTFRADFNRDALRFLIDEVWPGVRARLPQATLTIAGNGHAGALRADAEAAGARWLGFVDELADFFGAIDLLVVPLRYAGGIRIRILEALAAGVATVATPIAAAGLGLTHREEIRIAEGAKQLAEEIAAVLARPEEVRALGARGRAWCQAHHSVSALRPQRLAAIDDLLALSTDTRP